jgi:hypothetical protein
MAVFWFFVVLVGVFVVILAAGAIAGCMLSSEISQAEERRAREYAAIRNRKFIPLMPENQGEKSHE